MKCAFCGVEFKPQLIPSKCSNGHSITYGSQLMERCRKRMLDFDDPVKREKIIEESLETLKNFSEKLK